MNSVVRRIFNDSKTAVADDDLRANSSSTLQEGDSLVDTHGAYLLSPRRVAQEMNVPFVDANAVTHRLEQGLGPVKSKSLHVWYLPGEHPALPEGRQDNTHYNIHGAYTVAGLLAKEIVEAVPALKKYFKHLGLTGRSERRHHKLEKQVLDDASVIVAVSPPVQRDFQSMTDTPVRLITNGYDESDYESCPEEATDGYFRISHTGLFAADGIPETLWWSAVRCSSVVRPSWAREASL